MQNKFRVDITKKKGKEMMEKSWLSFLAVHPRICHVDSLLGIKKIGLSRIRARNPWKDQVLVGLLYRPITRDGEGITKVSREESQPHTRRSFVIRGIQSRTTWAMSRVIGSFLTFHHLSFFLQIGQRTEQNLEKFHCLLSSKIKQTVPCLSSRGF